MKTLTEEVEFLSKSNEKFLRELQSREYYTAYKEQNEELTKLREAHAILIDLIRTKEVKIAENEINKVKDVMTKRTQNRQSMSVFSPNTGLQGGSLSEIALSRLFTCKENTSLNGRDQQREAFEAMEVI